MPTRYRDYYQTLGVSRQSSQDDIQKAYRALARQHHPDVSKSPDADTRFKEISEAYEVLKDPDKRARYDALGHNWRAGDEYGSGASASANAGGFPFNQRSRAAGRSHPSSRGGTEVDFSDFFESLFGRTGASAGQTPHEEDVGSSGARAHGSRQRARPRRAGQDQRSALTISLADAYHAVAKDIALEITRADGAIERRTLSLRIPPGITDGAVMRLSGQGEAGEPAGDLLLTIHIAPDRHFRIDQDNHHDLHTTLFLAPHEAALGAKVPLRTLEGEIVVSVPPGSGSGQKLRIRGKGLPKKTGDRADLLVELRVMVPKSLHPDEKVLYEELARVSNFNPRHS